MAEPALLSPEGSDAMCKVIAVMTVLLALSAATVLAEEPAPEQARVEQDMAAVAAGNSEFALDLYARLREEEGNLFFSPYSISTALAMTYAGARERTAEQMAKVLHFGLPQERLHPAFKALIAQVNDPKAKGYQLSVANALWGQKGYGFLDEFLSLTRENYGAGLNEVDFKHATEPARLIINKWVEEQTNDKIKDLIAEGVMTDVDADEPYTAATEAQSRALAEQAFQDALTAENQRIVNLLSPWTVPCALGKEAKNAAGASHRVDMPCTYETCP